jgi:hypothetical protein
VEDHLPVQTPVQGVPEGRLDTDRELLRDEP